MSEFLGGDAGWYNVPVSWQTWSWSWSWHGRGVRVFAELSVGLVVDNMAIASQWPVSRQLPVPYQSYMSCQLSLVGPDGRKGEGKCQREGRKRIPD
jgi:hypothetical protein